MQYLGVIEQRTNEILQMYHAAQSGLSGDSSNTTAAAAVSNMLQQGPKLPAGAVAVSVDPPGYGDLSSGSESEEDSEQRPLNRAELMHKTLHLLNKNGLNPNHSDSMAASNSMLQ